MRATFLFLFQLFSITAFGQLLSTQGTQIINDQGEEILLRGVGPGGWQIMEGYMMQSSSVAGSQHEIKEKLTELMGIEKTEIFYDKWRQNHFTKQDVDSLAAWGYNSIRIPMHYNLFTLSIEEEPVEGEHSWIETGFELIDNVLEWSAPHNIYVILDLHAAPGGQGTGSEINDYDPDKPALWESDLNKAKTVALWARIAERYKDEKWIGGYDLINEPHWDLPGGTDLRKLYVQITEAIRAVDQSHILFIEGNWYANDFTGLTPAWDDNMVYSFHKYWSFNNDSDLDWILPLREQQNVPLWMGESGENSNTWFTDAVGLFEQNNIGWNWWTMRKIGDIDSPYAVDINPGYQAILDYWGGNGSQPTEQETFDAMMQLAENLLIENSRYRKDIPDALLRQPHTDETIPYSKHEIPGIIYLTDYDLGKNGFAYSDKDVADYHVSTSNFTAWNSGWSYRNDGVDIQTNNDQTNSNGFHIGFTDKGEWLKYTLEVKETAKYRAAVRLASDQPGSKFHLTMNNESITTSQLVAQTGGWDQFSTHFIEGVLLEAGEQELRMHFDHNSVNVGSIEFIKVSESADIPFQHMTAEAGSNERSINLSTNKSIQESSLEGGVEAFQISINGNEQVITNLSLLSSRTITLELDEYLLYSDDVKVSYNGQNIISVEAENLQTFTALSVINNLAQRFSLPNLVEAEDYTYQSGLRLEETTDTGGGQNIGYTDTNDFANYKILVSNEGAFDLSLRIAAENRPGSIGFYLLAEAGNETEIAVITVPVTGGWQNWESITQSVNLESGAHTLRMKVLSPGFNINWFRFDEDVVLSNQNEPTLSRVIVYPNPTQRFLTIENSIHDQFTILNFTGSKVMESEIPKNRRLDLVNLASGKYILLLVNQRTGDFDSRIVLVGN
jgi:hypothetical protein